MLNGNEPAITQPATVAHCATKLHKLVHAARDQHASDIHLEPGQPATFRVSSGLMGAGKPISHEDTVTIARELVSDEHWSAFLKRGSSDLSRTIEGVRCRINILRTSQGVGLAIRLLAAVVPTVEKLNLQPDLKQLSGLAHGLVLVSGPTGSGKSSTLAALVQEINQTASRHIITLEYPIEYQFEPLRSFIRQRELGRDVPSMQQGLVDALREDPDVLMVGEMREPETMRLTLNAAETGHLVFATIHSATTVEALERMISAFPSDIQNAVSSQLAECLAAVVCQRLRFHQDFGIGLPECEILRPTPGVKAFIRRGEFHQIASSLETGKESGMWTFTRYQEWMTNRTDWYVPPRNSSLKTAATGLS
jgi:twitching motility protein PilT